MFPIVDSIKFNTLNYLTLNSGDLFTIDSSVSYATGDIQAIKYEFVFGPFDGLNRQTPTVNGISTLNSNVGALCLIY